MHRANIQRTGIYQTKALRNLTGIKWKLQINSEPEITGLQVGFNCPLAIKDGVIYLCNKGYLYAIYSETGEEIWKIQIDNARLDNSILYKNIVYVSSSDGSFYAVNEVVFTKTRENWYGIMLGFVPLPNLPARRSH